MISLSTEDTVTTKEANGEQGFSQVLNTDYKMQKKFYSVGSSCFLFMEYNYL